MTTNILYREGVISSCQVMEQLMCVPEEALDEWAIKITI